MQCEGKPSEHPCKGSEKWFVRVRNKVVSQCRRECDVREAGGERNAVFWARIKQPGTQAEKILIQGWRRVGEQGSWKLPFFPPATRLPCSKLWLMTKGKDDSSAAQQWRGWAHLPREQQEEPPHREGALMGRLWGRARWHSRDSENYWWWLRVRPWVADSGIGKPKFYPAGCRLTQSLV